MMNNDISNEFTKIFEMILRQEEKNLKMMGLKELTLNELHVLIKIKKILLSGEIPTPRRLMNELQITKGTLSIVTTRLENKNYLIKKNISDDRRKIYFSLKEKSNYAISLHEEWHSKLVEIALGNFTKKDIDYIEKLLININSNIEKL